LIISQLTHVFECKSETKALFHINFLDNKKLIGAVLISLTIALCCVYLPWLQMIFETVALSFSEFIIVLGYVAIGPILGSLVNSIRFRKHNLTTRNDMDIELPQL